MNRAELEKISTTKLCSLLGISFKAYTYYGFTREQLIEMILTPQ